MFFPIKKIMHTIIYCLVFLFITEISVSAEELYSYADTSSISESNDSKGYSDIVLFKDTFIAVGTDGRIDCISKSGEKVPVDSSGKYNLNCAFSNDELIIAAGDHGTILYSSDGKNFYQVESGTEKKINGITFKNGLLVAGTDRGTILVSKNGKFWNALSTQIRGNILSLSANTSFFIGVSDSGEIVKSVDGITWEIQDYNREYAGYNQYSIFRKILASPNSIVIIGIHKDGSPSIVCSSLGNVWTERPPIYQDDQGVVQGLTNKPNGIAYDPERDQFVVVCDNGELLVLPPCSKCNKWAKISERNFHAIFYFNNCLLIVGEEFSVLIQRMS
jgi:hypothetical protein